MITNTRLFTHPLPVLAMLVLVLNDHVLKGAGILPGVVTGKLSDVSGLFFAPLLLCEGMLLIFRVRSQGSARRLLAASVLFFVALFSAIKLSDGASRLYEMAVGALIGRAENVVDPTDLLALPFAALAWAYGANRLATKTPAPRANAIEAPLGR